MKTGLFGLAATLAAALASTGDSRAATLDFTFSFRNATLEHGGLIEGIVRGLTDNATSAARSVEVTFNADGFGLGEYLGTAIRNSWQVENGRIVGVDFLVFGALNAELGNDAVTGSTFQFLIAESRQEAGLSFSATIAERGQTDITFTRTPDTMAPIPLPASALLLLSGLGGFALIRRRRGGRASGAGAGLPA